MPSGTIYKEKGVGFTTREILFYFRPDISVKYPLRETLTNVTIPSGTRGKLVEDLYMYPESEIRFEGLGSVKVKFEN